MKLQMISIVITTRIVEVLTIAVISRQPQEYPPLLAG